MRVIAGTRRSLPLRTVDSDDTRPTADRYKETLFNVIQGDIPDAKFLDLFAGSGAIGIEALSRGAKHATFVENGRKQLEVIKANIHFTKFENESDIMRGDAISYLRGLSKIDFDVIFIDPPYHHGLQQEALMILNQKQFRNPDALIIVEAASDEDMDFIEMTKFEIVKMKDYKTNRHIFMRIKAEK